MYIHDYGRSWSQSGPISVKASAKFQPAKTKDRAGIDSRSGWVFVVFFVFLLQARSISRHPDTRCLTSFRPPNTFVIWLEMFDTFLNTHEHTYAYTYIYACVFDTQACIRIHIHTLCVCVCVFDTRLSTHKNMHTTYMFNKCLKTHKNKQGVWKRSVKGSKRGGRPTSLPEPPVISCMLRVVQAESESESRHYDSSFSRRNARPRRISLAVKNRFRCINSHTWTGSRIIHVLAW
jgi:hypothetical protein